MRTSFLEALHTAGPAPDRAGSMGLYAWLVGSWEMDAVLTDESGSRRNGTGEIHAGWVLEGRAVQDVWILPGVFYGTTLRIYDPHSDSWHILWSDPVRQLYRRQIGRAAGADIVQEGTDDLGVPTRWRFIDITPDSFRWLGERLPEGATGWQIQAEFLARRAAGGQASREAREQVA
jgi:hypothetical protein